MFVFGVDCGKLFIVKQVDRSVCFEFQVAFFIEWYVCFNWRKVELVFVCW